MMSSKSPSLHVNCPSSPSNISHSHRSRSPKGRKSHPISSCGPMENGFLQCYADLYASAVMYSDPDFQQRLLFPNVHGHGHGHATTKPSGESKSRNYTKSRKSPLQQKEPSSTVGEGQGQSSAKSVNRLRVSFSKHTQPGMHPNADADDKDHYLSGAGSRRRSSMSRAQASVERMQNSPKITLEDKGGSGWSSDMDETDTTASDSADQSFFSSSIDDDYDDEPDDKDNDDDKLIKINGISTHGSRSLPEPEDSDLSPNPTPTNTKYN